MPPTPRPLPDDHEVRVEELRAIRAQLALTQPQMAALLGCETTLLCHYERGRRRIPENLLALARTLPQQPQALPMPRPAPPMKRPRAPMRFDVAFVLVQALDALAPCWHGRDPSRDEEKVPCAETNRMQLTVLLPPTPRIDRRVTQTVTCEVHAAEAIFWMQKHYRRWAGQIQSPRVASWRRRWLQLLRRIGEEAPKPYTGRPRGRPKKSVAEEAT